MKRKKSFLIICLLLLLLVGFTIFFLFGRSDGKILLPVDENAEDWDGDQRLPNGEKQDTASHKNSWICSSYIHSKSEKSESEFQEPGKKFVLISHDIIH